MKEREGCQLFADTVFDPMEPQVFIYESSPIHLLLPLNPPRSVPRGLPKKPLCERGESSRKSERMIR